ncbi:serine hydrolase domain-containing protein [Chitinophaga alhagiae]|uniref:serine hydrolase domain-containing protein n=1 Tax=Chitinophaga alhagiae TaxID=2203219 RepID=UPI000E5AEC62|nr:serine hydrolase domain-containing protein [Chitinophaga alhagiae]
MNLKYLRIGCCLAGALAFSQARAQQQDSVVQRLNRLVASYSNQEPGGVLIVSRQGQHIFHKAFGVANLEQPLPITDTTLFEAASVSKQFTATALLLLVRQGKLQLEDDIRKYFPQLPNYGRTITVRQCLTHTSGLKDWRNVTYLTSWPTGYRLMDQAFALQTIFRQANLNYTPGERFSYTNAGYDLAARLVEQLTGMPFSRFVQDSLLAPAGMTHSFFRKGFRVVTPGRATGYYLEGKTFRAGTVMDESYGAAGLITTAGDLQKWLLYVNHHFGPDDPFTTMRLERYVLNNGDTCDYANGGVYVKHIKGITQISHSGFLAAFRALTTYYPQGDYAVSYVGNNQEISTTELNNEIFSILFDRETSDPLPYTEKDTIPTRPADLAGKTGNYINTTDSSDVLQFFVRNNRLLQYRAPLHALPGGRFLYDKAIYQFAEKGGSLTITRGGTATAYTKVTFRTISPALQQQLAGAYHSEDCDVTIYLQPHGKALMMHRAPSDSVLLEPVYNNGTHVGYKGFDHRLRAIYDFTVSGGKVARLSISLPRANRIYFYKTKENGTPRFLAELGAR